MTKLNVFDWITMILVVIGGLNWGILGLFGVDVISAMFGELSVLTRIIFVLVGLSAIYFLFILPRLAKSHEEMVVKTS